MAPKRTSPPNNPPAASSLAEKSGSGSGSESEYETDSDEEPQQTQPPKATSVVAEKNAPPPPKNKKRVAEKNAPPPPKNKKRVAEKNAPPPPKNKKPVAEKNADGESDSDSESESDGSAAEETSSKQQQPLKSTLTPPAKASAAKRPTEPEPKHKEANKRRKKDSDPAPAPAPAAPAQNRPLFQRVWSEEDEIAILEGMIAYSAKKGVSPNSNLAAFLDYIKKFLKFDVSLPQLKNKMSRLKKRYTNCVAKEKKGQKPVNHVKPHEAKIYQLLVKMWGGTGTGGEASTGINGGLPPKKKKADSGLKPLASSDVVLYKCLGDVGIPEALLKEGLEMIGAQKQADMKDDWMKLRLAELELGVRRSQLMREHATFILEAVKSSER